jgi:hypothetical protein
MWPAASEPCARMFEQRLRGHGLWRPLQQPHTRTAYRKSEKGHGRVTSWKIRRTLARARMVDGDSSLLQDGEGWKPQSVHQSILLVGTIYHRPLGSEVLGALANERRRVEPPGAIAFRGRARLASFCKATAAIADSVRASVRPRTNDQRARAERSRPSRSVCLARSCIEAVWKIASVCRSRFGKCSESRPLRSISPRRGPGRVRKFKKTAASSSSSTPQTPAA